MIVVCFGAEAAAYRTELYPAYHADRPPVPDALDWQFQQAPELFAAFGWLAVTPMTWRPTTCSARSPRPRSTPAAAR